MTESLIRLNGNPSSVAWHNVDVRSSPHLYEGFGKLPVKDENWVHIDPDQSSTDNKTRFVLTLEQHMIGQLILEWDQAALTTGGAAGTYHRFVDYFPYEFVDRIELRYLTKVVQRIQGQQFHLENFTIKDERQIERDAFDVAGFLSIAQRNTEAGVVQRIRLRLPFYFTRSPKDYLPLFMMEKAPIIDIFWNDLIDVIQTDGAGPWVSARSNIRMRMETIYLTDSLKKEIAGRLDSGNGISYYYRDIIALEERIITSTDALPFPISLTPFNQEIASIFAYIRRRNEVEGGPTVFRGHENLLPWLNYTLKSGSKILRDQIDYEDTLYEDNEKYLLSSLGLNILGVYMSDNVIDVRNVYGSKPIGAMNTVTMNLALDPNFLPAPGNDIRVDLYALFHNIISLRYSNTQGQKILIWESIYI